MIQTENIQDLFIMTGIFTTGTVLIKDREYSRFIHNDNGIQLPPVTGTVLIHDTENIQDLFN